MTDSTSKSFRYVLYESLQGISLDLDQVELFSDIRIWKHILKQFSYIVTRVIGMTCRNTLQHPIYFCFCSISAIKSNLKCLLYKGLSTSRLCSELGSFVLEIVVLQWKQGLEWLVNVYSSSMTDWNLVSHIRDVYFLQQETTTSWNLHLLTKLSKNMCSFVFLLSFSFIFEYFSTSLKYHDRKIWDLQHWKHKYNDSTDKSNAFIKQDL